jgi:predicted AAA+ superfamily ATPase
MIVRKIYQHQLENFINLPFIKIITGIRRSGKSSVLRLLRDQILQRGVLQEQIIHLNFESFVYSDVRTSVQLYNTIASQIQPGKKSYILLDEIQEINEWEKCVNALSVDFDVDVYLTGSNSHLLSSELATYLAGRYVEIPVFTLSFKECLQFRSVYGVIESNHRDSFTQYLRLGGFPAIHTGPYSEDTAWKIVYDIYSSVLLRDTVQRYSIREVELLERVIRYAMDNLGNTFSGKNIADFFKSQQRKIDLNTVYNYLNALEGAFILYRVPRYDLKGKEILKTQEKFYLSDVSLLYATMGYSDRRISGVLENLVFLELKRRGYAVYVGKSDAKEIDFVAEKQGKKIYIQVAFKLESTATIEREFSTLLNIKDQFPKYVVTMDEFWKDSMEGVEHWHIADFLLSDRY